MKKYKIVNGTSYSYKTTDKVISIIERCRLNETRIILDYGDVTTGTSWDETFDITGYIGRSTGNIKIPLLIYNKRSLGGGGVVDACIIGIKTSKGKHQLYRLNKQTEKSKK